MNKLPVLCVALTLCSYQLFSMAPGVALNPNQQQSKQNSSLVQAYRQHLQQVIKPLPSYHLIAYDSTAPAQRDNKGFLARLSRDVKNLITPKINLPHLQEGEGPYPDQGPELEQALAREVQTSVKEEARITRELKSWQYLFKRIAGVGIVTQAIWWPFTLAANGIAKIIGATPMPRSDFMVGGAAMLVAGIITQEIMRRMFYVPDCYKTINAHRRHIQDQFLVSTDMAQRLKAHLKFQNNSDAARVIDAMTNPLAH